MPSSRNRWSEETRQVNLIEVSGEVPGFTGSEMGHVGHSAWSSFREILRRGPAATWLRQTARRRIHNIR
jgi:hypothetical protein